ncbi:MAG: CAP domain-containing protein, partial [Rhodospirillaceae bacterium]|nr:CAP domain-containing protein [Rhodospirillaceae bacterium]
MRPGRRDRQSAARRRHAAAIAVFAFAAPIWLNPAASVAIAAEPVPAADRRAPARSKLVWAKPRLRSAAQRRQAARGQAGRPGRDRLECKAWKYHGADRIPRPYDPDRFVYTEEYKRAPDRPGREEAARRADAAFPQLIDAKVLRMLHLINRVRERRGHTAMKLEPRLMVAAKRHNLDIARHALMQHTGTDCSQLVDRVWDEGYTWRRIAENLAGGRATAEATMQQWTGSAVHLMQMTLTG